MVLHGRVREVNRFGNNAADEAADFGRRRVGNAIIDARRNLSGGCGRWYLVILDFHRFFIAISRAVVNHDGKDGTAPDPPVWSAGALPERRRLVHAVRNHAFLPGPPGIWDSEWVHIPAAAFCAEDITWPAGGLGVGGISYVELLIFLKGFGQVRDFPWKRLILGIFGQGFQFQCRLFLVVQALIFGAHTVSLVL